MAIYPQHSMNHAVRKGGISSFFDLFVIRLTDVSISGLKKKSLDIQKKGGEKGGKDLAFHKIHFL